MVAIAHFIAISCYVGAAALAAAPFVRPVRAPVGAVVGALAAGVVAHGVGLGALAAAAGHAPITGLGPALSFAGLVLALVLLAAEALAREASLALVAAPLAALTTTLGNLLGLRPLDAPEGTRGVWLVAHIALSFLGIAAFATAAAAGAMYLVQRRELKSRRFASVFRFFPPLDTLDRVNKLAALAGWLGLTLGVVLAVTYSVTYRAVNVPQILWGTGAWIGVTAPVLGRLLRGWQARRAAVISSVSFAVVVALYVAMRVAGAGSGRGQFL